MSNLSFEERLALLSSEGNPYAKQNQLKTIKDKSITYLDSKKYQEPKKYRNSHTRESEDDDDNEFVDNQKNSKGKGNSLKTSNAKKDFKRNHKHAPMEISSKKPVSRWREVVEVEKQPKKIMDPRFNPLTGHLNEGLYKKAYGFIDELEEQEMDALRKQIVKEKNSEEIERLKKLLQSMESKRTLLKKKEKSKDLKRKWKKAELEAIKEGKKPFYLKQSELKRLELVEKYKNMDKHAIDKLLEKKRKRNAAEERKFIPRKRQVPS